MEGMESIIDLDKSRLVKRRAKDKQHALSLYPEIEQRELIDECYLRFKERLNEEGFKAISKSSWILMLLEGTLSGCES